MFNRVKNCVKLELQRQTSSRILIVLGVISERSERIKMLQMSRITFMGQSAGIQEWIFRKLWPNHGHVGLAGSGIPATCKEVVSSYRLGLIQMDLVTTVPLFSPARRKQTASCKKDLLFNDSFSSIEVNGYKIASFE